MVQAFDRRRGLDVARIYRKAHSDITGSIVTIVQPSLLQHLYCPDNGVLSFLYQPVARFYIDQLFIHGQDR